MQSMSIDDFALFYGEEEGDTIELVRQACQKSMRLIEEHWGLEPPEDCRVYIMTSWYGFAFRSAPWPWKILLAMTIPLWAFRARKIWPLAGGWEQRYGRRRTVGVKPPRLLQLADRRIGDRFFIHGGNVGEKVQSITCHELTHAFTSHLQLPTWLKEGLAMVTVDRFFEKPTVRHETLQHLERAPGKRGLGGRQKVRVGDEDALWHLYARSYWLTRYIEETRPGLLRDLLSRGCRSDEFESEISAAYGKNPKEFWAEIDRVLLSHFRQRDETI